MEITGEGEVGCERKKWENSGVAARDLLGEQVRDYYGLAQSELIGMKNPDFTSLDLNKIVVLIRIPDFLSLSSD